MQWGLFLLILMGQLSFFTCDDVVSGLQTVFHIWILSVILYRMILITEYMTWVNALNYCRQKYRDLVSITGQEQQNRVQEEAKNASSNFVWLGLRYSCPLDLWFWVNDKMVCFDNWASENNSQRCDWAAAMKKNEDHKWVKKADDDQFNFICTSGSN